MSIANGCTTTQVIRGKTMDKRNFVCDYIDNNKNIFIDAANAVWGYAEPGMQEYKSAEYLEKVCEDNGFKVTKGVAEIPTAFVAEWGEGHPIIGFLAEYDALPGLSQEGSCNVHKPLDEANTAYGHGCGHHLLGAGAMAGAFGLKEYLEKNNIKGTVRYYGCPGEEYGSGKAFMAREGLFDDVDACFTWHPGDRNEIVTGGSLACYSIFFKFAGKTAHAAGAPHMGRSALDACELMNVGVNYLREHVIPEARMHYAYTDVGGIAPNVVQDHAGLHYFVRAPRVADMMAILERIKDIAKGAALMTGTTVQDITHEALSDFVPNDTLNVMAHKALTEVGLYDLDDADMEMAKKFRDAVTDEEVANSVREFKTTYGIDLSGNLFNRQISPLKNIELASKGSTDVGDTSYCTPTVQFHVATQIIGTPGHSWKITGQGTTSYAHKGMLTAGKAMALAGIYALEDPELCKKAREELDSKTNGGYKCPMPADLKPTI